MIHTSHAFAKSHLIHQVVCGSDLPTQGSSYEAPGAAALNHCLKPPAQVGRKAVKVGGWEPSILEPGGIT